MASGLSIPPGASFDLRISFLPDEEAGTAPDGVFINESHYDNSGTDSGEFVEVVVGPGYTGSLSEISLLLYNGADGTVYGTHPLGTFQDFQEPEITASGHRIYHKMIGGIQNGAPDGFALAAGSSVLQFISYEGSFIASDGAAAGMLSTDIGVSQNGNELVGQSAIGLAGSGGNATDFTWIKFTGTAHSPGTANAGQTFVNPGKPPQGLAFDNLAVEFLTDNDLDGDPDIVDPDDDNDGHSDAYEIAFGSDPFDRKSRFEPLLVRAAEGLSLSFPGATGIDYTVECSETLDAWQDVISVPGTGAMIVVPLPMEEPAMFFRVRASGPAP
jgi:hypothetical protein